MDSASSLVVFSLDDEDLKGRSKLKCMLKHLRRGIPLGWNITNHLLWLNPDLATTALKFFQEHWAVHNFHSQSTKIDIAQNMHQNHIQSYRQRGHLCERNMASICLSRQQCINVNALAGLEDGCINGKGITRSHIARNLIIIVIHNWLLITNISTIDFVLQHIQLLLNLELERICIVIRKVIVCSAVPI